MEKPSFSPDDEPQVNEQVPINEFDLSDSVVRKIPGHGEIWKEDIELSQEVDEHYRDEDIFGSDFVKSFEIVNGIGDEYENIKYLPEDSRENIINRARERFDFLEEKINKSFAKLFTTDRRLFLNLLEVYYRDQHPDWTDAKVIDAVKNESLLLHVFGILPQYENEKIVDILKANNKRVRKIQTETEVKKEIYISDFKNLIEPKVANGDFPVDLDIVNQRLGLVQITVVDDVLARLQKIGGDYDVARHRVRITAGEIESPDGRGTIIHELFHAISGQTFHVVEYPQVDLRDINNTKIGTRFNPRPYSLNTILTPQLDWLNEAITEQAVIDTIGASEDDSYPHERKLLSMILAYDIPLQTFYKAYFEDYGVDPDQHKLPHMRNVFNEVGEKLGRNFLANLDLFIKDNGGLGKGAEQAIKKWEKMGPRFPELINEGFYKRKLKKKLSQE